LHQVTIHGKKIGLLLLHPKLLNKRQKKLKNEQRNFQKINNGTIKKGICRKIKERSVVLKITIHKINDKNINISLILENTNVFKAAFIV